MHRGMRGVPGGVERDPGVRVEPAVPRGAHRRLRDQQHGQDHHRGVGGHLRDGGGGGDHLRGGVAAPHAEAAHAAAAASGPWGGHGRHGQGGVLPGPRAHADALAPRAALVPGHAQRLH